jgi:hypothetical protein
MRVDFKQQKYRHPKLRKLLAWLEKETGFEFTETSGYRKGDKGVHGVGRGSDLRCRDASLGKNIEALINGEWQYDPKRPDLKCCILHGEGANLHLHIQVHPNTIKRG